MPSLIITISTKRLGWRVASRHRMGRVMSSFMAKTGELQQRWYVIDATDQVVGRLAVQIANILRGKHRPEYTPHCDTGDFVVVINAEKVKFTGNKWQTEEYQWYTRYPGGLKTVTAKVMLKSKP